MRCTCYARYSSDLQRETSIDDQVAVRARRAISQPQGCPSLDSLEGTPLLLVLKILHSCRAEAGCRARRLQLDFTAGC